MLSLTLKLRASLYELARQVLAQLLYETQVPLVLGVGHMAHGVLVRLVHRLIQLGAGDTQVETGAVGTTRVRIVLVKRLEHIFVFLLRLRFPLRLFLLSFLFRGFLLLLSSTSRTRTRNCTSTNRAWLT